MSNRLAELKAMIEQQSADIKAIEDDLKIRREVLAATNREMWQLERTEKQTARAKQTSKLTPAGACLLRQMYNGDLLQQNGYDHTYQIHYAKPIDWRSWETVNAKMVERLIEGGFIAKLVWVSESEWGDRTKRFALTATGLAAAQKEA